MRAPAFWKAVPRLWTPGFALMLLLAPIGWLVGAVTAWRMGLSGYRAKVPVICVGNLVAGGAGKTPTALKLADIIAASGLRPVFLIRGYGGTVRGPALVDPTSTNSIEVGDEALLLAQAHPTIVARDRAAGARAAIEAGADLIIMDDGFQNPAIEKDLTLVVVDAGAGVGNGLVLPAGPLRAPVAAQMLHADALIIIGHGSGAVPAVRFAARRAMPVFAAHLKPEIPTVLRHNPVLAFAGIGRPEKFFETLRDAGLEVSRTLGFADHHPYSEDEAGRLLDLADAQDLVIATTAKDHVRLEGGPMRTRLGTEAHVVRVVLQFEDEKPLRALIDPLLKPLLGQQRSSSASALAGSATSALAGSATSARAGDDQTVST